VKKRVKRNSDDALRMFVGLDLHKNYLQAAVVDDMCKDLPYDKNVSVKHRPQRNEQVQPQACIRLARLQAEPGQRKRLEVVLNLGLISVNLSYDDKRTRVIPAYVAIVSTLPARVP
jgi:hypothetical protein